MRKKDRLLRAVFFCACVVVFSGAGLFYKKGCQYHIFLHEKEGKNLTT
jgi:hypothetical protein